MYALVLGCAVLAVPVRAQSTPLPPPLAPWVEWVLHDVPERACVMSRGERMCEWPGQVVLELGARGGRFEQRAFVDRPLYLRLPGGKPSWPLQVRVDGQLVPVLDRDGPVVLLTSGAHRIEGRFEWPALPQRLELPKGVAQVGLSVEGRKVPLPRRDDQGQLWLQEHAADKVGESDSVRVAVMRKLQDGVPLIVTTVIELRVAGRPRELNLGRVLLDDSAPLAIESELPARIEADGALRVQLRAGDHRVTVRARTLGSPEQLVFSAAKPPWPEGEVWVREADDTLRQVELGGPPAVDPARTELPGEWRGLPAFAVAPGTALRLKTVRRGEPSPPPNNLAIDRELWLDLDGAGFTARDRLSAELRRDFRLDLLAGDLGHVRVDGEDVLVTRAPGRSHAGVELRSASQQLEAEWRGQGALGSLPAVGWSQDVQRLQTRLHMGPGFQLLGVDGPDDVSQSWIQDWNLLDLFVVLLVAIAVTRLIGRRAGLLALATLVLCHGEPDAPGFLFFGVLAGMALLHVLPEGRFRRLATLGYVVSAALLLLNVVPFLAQQVRTALYPQLGLQPAVYDQRQSAGRSMSLAERLAAPFESEALMDRAVERDSPSMGPGDEAAAPAPAMSPPADDRDSPKQFRPRSGALDRQSKAYDSSSTGSAVQQAALGPQHDPEATVQTGPGVPTWSWRTWTLSWTGPVDRAQELTVYVLPPWATRLLGAMRVLLLALLVMLLLRRGGWPTARPSPQGTQSQFVHDPSVGGPPAPVTQVALIVGVLLAPSAVHAQLPSPELLDNLRARLTETPRCDPQCATIDELRIEVGPTGLRLVLTIHAGALATIALPGPASSWTPSELDGKGDTPARLDTDGFMRVRVPAGVHVLSASGVLPGTETLTLSFADVPQRTRVQAEGFEVGGVREDGSVEATVELSRAVAAQGAGRGGESPAGEPLESAELPPFLMLERRIVLGVQWQVQSRLTRLSPTGSPLRVRVPLLTGESVTAAGMEATTGALQVSFGRDQQQMEWSSNLRPSDSLELVASADRPYSERWRVACGPIWSCEFTGLSPTRHLHLGRFEPEFRPLPAERVSVRVRRPEAAPGAAVTIDEAQLNVSPGARLLKAELVLNVRSSRRASERIELPPGAQVQSFMVGEHPRPIRVEKGALHYALEPGAHMLTVQWQQTRSEGLVTSTPELALGRAVANLRLLLEVPRERWLLWASGPAYGPAVLFWGYLLLVLGLAFGLGRIRSAPLRTHQFMLLGAGLTHLSAFEALSVVAWFFVLAWRGRRGDVSRLRHNLTQVGLIAFTLYAAAVLYEAVHAGLLLYPDMQVAGAGSHTTGLHWIVDRVANRFPVASMISVPLWVYRVLMLLWALWLAVNVVRWAAWAFRCFAQGGLWKKRPPRVPAAPAMGA